MEDREFSIVCSALDDCRRLIAAGKVHRWDVIKWSVTVNLALAAVSIAHVGATLPLFLLAAAVSFGAGLLVWHYNTRITGARGTAADLVKKLKESGLDNSLVKTDPAHDYSEGKLYDKEELITFTAILAITPFLVLLGCAVR